MVNALILTALAAQSPASLEFAEGAFVVKSGESEISVSLDEHNLPAAFPADEITLTIQGRSVVFGERGLGIKTGNTLNFSRLPAIAMTPKLFTQGEIDETFHAIEAGTREKGFEAISGFESVGSMLYVLARWENSDGTPWLEAVVGIDLAEERPGASLVGRLDGLSLARGRVDDRLHSRAGSLVALTNEGDEWGYSQLNLESGESEFQPFGPLATASKMMGKGVQTAASLSRSAYGTILVTFAEIEAASSQVCCEIRGPVKALFGRQFLRYVRNGEHVIVNLKTGAQLTVSAAASTIETEAGLLSWAGGPEPGEAVLYDTASLRALAFWVAED
jgi:hypothetical protein